jgi:haloacetate dehalogenase
VLWSAHDDLEDLHGDPLRIWADWTSDLRGGGRIDSGHHVAEEAPEELVAALVPFLACGAGSVTGEGNPA